MDSVEKTPGEVNSLDDQIKMKLNLLLAMKAVPKEIKDLFVSAGFGYFSMPSFCEAYAEIETD